MSDSCCQEYAAMRVSRRGMLAGAMSLAGASTLVGSAVVTASPARAQSASAVLVVLSLRGASDGLSLVVPHSDPVYYQARPRIAVPSDRLLVKDATFGLHPALDALLPMWAAGQVAAVHATGLPAPNRSHFSAMEEVEDADPGSTARIGWLNRLVGELPGGSPLQGFSASGGVLPTSLSGPVPTMSAGDVDDVRLPGSDDDGRRARSLRTLWHREKSTLGQSMRSTFEAIPAEVGLVVCKRVNFVPRPEDGEPFWRRMTLRETESFNDFGRPLPPKVAHRAHPEITVKQGNHKIEDVELGESLDDGRIQILHFPMRSYAQFENKIAKGGAAYARNKDLPKRTGRTWRLLYEKWQQGELREHYDANVAAEDGDAELVIDERLRDFFASRASQE